MTSAATVVAASAAAVPANAAPKTELVSALCATSLTAATFTVAFASDCAAKLLISLLRITLATPETNKQCKKSE